MNDELWIKKIKEQLEDYSDSEQVLDWERLEKELITSVATNSKERRVIPLRRWMVVAATLLTAVSSVSLWLLHSSIGDEVRHTTVPAFTFVPDVLPEQNSPTQPTVTVEASSLVRENVQACTSVLPYTVVSSAQETSLTDGEWEESVFQDEEKEGEEHSTFFDVGTESERQDESQHHTAGVHRSSGKEKIYFSTERKSKKRGWTMGLSVGNTGGLNNLSNKENFIQSDPPLSSSIEKPNFMVVTDAILYVPEGKEVYFKDGLPHLRNRERKVVSVDHRQPLNFGISVRKNLSNGFSLETGVTYTYLASDVRLENSTDKYSQKLHYLGIPLRGNWNFVDKDDFIVYLSAGGTVEKCVYGRLGNERETINPLQFSLMGAVGAQYNVNKKVGLYVEPGLSYFFDDGSKIQTIRKENPCNFTLQAGVRLTY